MPSANNYGKSQAGTVFLITLVILTVLLFLGASLVERADNGLLRASTDNQSAQSFHRAEAGVNKAVYELRLREGWGSYNGESNVPLGQGRFDVAVTPLPASRASHTTIAIDAAGYELSSAGMHRNPRRIRALLKRNQAFPFDHAIAAQNAVDIGNSQIDSFRSEDGPYGAGTARTNASVAVNTTQYVNGVSGVAIGANGVLKGNIQVGATAASAAAGVSNHGTLTGSVGSLTSPMDFAPVTIPAGATDLGAISLSGGSIFLTAGVYRASSISISGNGNLIVDGKVTLYVDGNIDIAGNGAVNQDSGKPRNFVILGTQNCTSVRIHGASTFYGGVYAPNADINLQESITAGEIFGAFAGRNVRLMGSQTRFHYDEDMAYLSDAGVQICSWQAF